MNIKKVVAYFYDTPIVKSINPFKLRIWTLITVNINHYHYLTIGYGAETIYFGSKLQTPDNFYVPLPNNFPNSEGDFRIQVGKGFIGEIHSHYILGPGSTQVNERN